MRKRIDITCPGCKSKDRTTTFDELGVEDISVILDRSKFIYECPKCKQKTVLDYSVLFHGNGYDIFYTPNNESKKGVKRICSEFGDFKEKIMIFEDGLNDILIEYFKKYIQRQINKNDELRYDGKDEENIIFYNIDTKDSLAINIELYNYFFNKFTFKDKDDIEVTCDNFIKYMKS